MNPLTALLERRFEPRPGDRVVAVYAPLNGTEPLDVRVNKLAVLMAKALHGNRLRKVLEFDAKDAVAMFAVSGEYHPPADLDAKVEEWPLPWHRHSRHKTTTKEMAA